MQFACLILLSLTAIPVGSIHHLGIQDHRFIEKPRSALASGTLDSEKSSELAESCSLQDHHFIDYCILLQTLGRLSILLLFAWTAVLIWLLNSTAQEFFVPPLVYWCQVLKLQPGFAGATLVALGNGAPDAFAMISSPLAIDVWNLVLSGMMCVICITGGAVLFARARRPSVEIRGDAWKLHTVNLLGLGSAIVCMAFILSSGDISFHSAGLMPLLYLAYVIGLACLDEGSAPLSAGKALLDIMPPPLTGLAWPRHASVPELFLWVLAWPTYVVRWAVIPPCDRYWDRTRRNVCSLAPVAFLLFCEVCYIRDFAAFLTPAGLLSVFMAFLCSVAMYTGSDDGPSVPWFYPAITIVAKVSSVLVLLVVSRELVCCIQAVGLAFGVPRTVIESTVIPWGNSVGDLVTGLAMVRQGQSEAALTAVFAGPTFNCFVGAGLALVLESHRHGQVAFETSVSLWMSLRVHLAFLAGAGTLIAMALACPHQRTWLWPLMLWALYATYILQVTLGEGSAGHVAAFWH